LQIAALISALAATAQAQTPPRMKMTTDIPASIITPDSVETRLGTLKFTDGFPDDATVEKVYDNLDFQRGIQAFLNAMPGASVHCSLLQIPIPHNVAGLEGRSPGHRDAARHSRNR
jgi:hypothetical protein